MHFTHQNRGTCSSSVEFDIDEQHVVSNVRFNGGCPGNTVGVARLANNRKAEDLVEMLSGIPCRDKNTSCPDQLAQGIKEALARL